MRKRELTFVRKERRDGREKNALDRPSHAREFFVTVLEEEAAAGYCERAYNGEDRVLGIGVDL